jgi:hypothetical protein
MSNKPFEQLVLLIDRFYQSLSLPVKRGPKPLQEEDWYLKLYFFGILNRCPEKSRFLTRAEKEYPRLFKKTEAQHHYATFVEH